MPKEIKGFKCEFCGTIYESEDKAIVCENTHAEMVEVVTKYKQLHEYPDEITVRFDTTKIIHYKREYNR